jgi:hypothetical protein
VEEKKKGECEVRRVAAALGVPFIGLERGEAVDLRSSMVAGECALKLAVSKMRGTRCGVGSLGKRKVRTEEGTASGGAWCGDADRAGGGGSGGGRRRLPKVGWARVAGWAECHLGRGGEKAKMRVGWAARMTGPK